jgi:DNA-directed RNA polymerase specialized sigma24 family protein
MIQSFEFILPEISRRSARHFSHLPADAREEAVQESIVQAWALFRSARKRGNDRCTPATLSWYAHQAVDAGRKFGGYTKRDALDRTVSLERFADGGVNKVGLNLLGRYPNPLEATRVSLDWASFEDLLTERQRDIVTKLSEGWRRSEIAQYLGLTPGRVTQILKHVASAYREMFG